jgi:hypothetical protein
MTIEVRDEVGLMPSRHTPNLAVFVLSVNKSVSTISPSSSHRPIDNRQCVRARVLACMCVFASCCCVLRRTLIPRPTNDIHSFTLTPRRTNDIQAAQPGFQAEEGLSLVSTNQIYTYSVITQVALRSLDIGQSP